MKLLLALISSSFLLERRRRDLTTLVLSNVSLISLFLILGLSSSFLDAPTLRRIFPVLFWTIFFLSSTMALGRSFYSELETGVVDRLRLMKIPLSLVFIAKQVVVASLLALGQLVSVLLFVVFSGLSIAGHLGALLVLVCTVSIAFAPLACLIAAVAFYSRLRASFLPVLLLPLSFPLYFAAVEMTFSLLVENHNLVTNPWFGFSLLTGVLYTLVSVWLFPMVVKE